MTTSPSSPPAEPHGDARTIARAATASAPPPTPPAADASTSQASGADVEARWPDVATVPRASRLRRAVARGIVRRGVAGIPIRVELPDGTVLGAGGATSGGVDADADLPRLVVHRPEAFFARLGVDAKIGFGEAYLAGDWSPGEDTDLADLLTPLAARMATLVPAPLQRLRRLAELRQPAGEDGSVTQAPDNIRRHYDLSNELFAAFLDETMTYSSARFDGVPAAADGGVDLAAGQRRKIDAVLDLAGVRSGSRVLEIGTGWGALAIRAAERGASVTTITLSVEQHALAVERVRAAGVDDRVEVRIVDYREVNGVYDAIVSVEMIEAVGARYWPAYFATLDRLLAPGGRIGLQAITMDHDRLLATRHAYSWIHKYVFPGGLIPSLEAIGASLRDHTTLTIERAHAFGHDYATTLRCWRERFLAAWPTIEGERFDTVFRRMWEFYLAYCEAGFRSGYLDVQQLAIARPGSRPATA